MGIKQSIVKPFAKRISKNIQRWAAKPIEAQEKQFQALLEGATHTKFGKDHAFAEIKNYDDFKQRVPIRDYEGLKDYVELIKQGKHDILWKGLPKYFAKTSGTTSGAKYIPLTKESIPNHFGTARNALFHNIAQTGNGDFVDGKLIFLSGSPEMTETNGILTGRLSGIVNHQIPSWLKRSQVPSWETNCIEEWEEKLDRIVEETYDKDMRMISGIPPWVQMYYERLLEKTGKDTIMEIFPNYSMFVYGGVNFEPYRSKLEELIGASIPTVETYPASEGFIAFQDLPVSEGLLLNVDSGIFFEFIPAGEIFDEKPTRLSLKDVELGVNYAIIINNNAGLWGYNIGDTVEFVSKTPYRIRVTGRIKHFISAFGEHVIGKEVDEAMNMVARKEGIRIIEFTVAPEVSPANEELPYHEWFVAFDNMPDDMTAFADKLDAEMVKQNIYYQDLIGGKVLQKLKVTPVQKDAFREYMRTQGKLGGQNKVPRLANDRKIAGILEKYAL
jgi:hypothetical protein